MEFSLHHLLSALVILASSLNHVSIVSTLSASAWVDILEAFELELSTGFDWSILLSNCIVGMNLSVCFPDLHRAFRVSFLILHRFVLVLKLEFGLVSKLVLHDGIDGSLGPERTTICECFGR